MPTPTYTPLATVTLGSSAASVTFSSIPGTYRDLILTIAHSKSALTTFRMNFNGDTTSGNYSGIYMAGSFTSPISGTGIDLGYGQALSLQQIQIMDYSATDKHKTHLIRHNRIEDQILAQATRWANTAAITSLSLVSNSGTFSTGSTFNLFGVIA